MNYPPFSKMVVNSYKSRLIDAGFSSSTINFALSVVKAISREAADNGILDPLINLSIRNVKGVPHEGARLGRWLSRDEAQTLLNSPPKDTLRGNRDRAILAVFLGTGLRRSEVASLTFNMIERIENRWVIVGLLGKGNKTRNIPIAEWTKNAIDHWSKVSGIMHGYVFRKVYHGDFAIGDHLGEGSLWNIITQYAKSSLGRTISPHDLRRTFAKLASNGGANLQQLSLTLGHSSIKTTEIYLGTQLDLENAVCDYVDLSFD